MGPVAVVQQPEHGKAHRTAQVIGADRVLPEKTGDRRNLPPCRLAKLRHLN